jgi:hypothetical protein
MPPQYKESDDSKPASLLLGASGITLFALKTSTIRILIGVGKKNLIGNNTPEKILWDIVGPQRDVQPGRNMETVANEVP